MKFLALSLLFPLAAAAAAPRALEQKTIKEAPKQPHFEFLLGDRKIHVGSGVWKIAESAPGWNKMYGWGPVVWISEKGKKRVLDLRADFPSQVVSHVFHDAEGGKIFLFLDNGIEGPAPVYSVWISDDRGEHWIPGAPLPRPPLGEFPASSLESFYLDAAGNGTATLKLAASNLNPTIRGKIALRADVFFRVTTSDAGKSWHAEAAPAFSSVIQSDEEQHP